MTNNKQGGLWRNALLWVAAAFFLLSMPCIFFGLLGLVGALADVGPAENRQMGLQLFQMAAIPLGLSGLVLIAAIVVRRYRPK